VQVEQNFYCLLLVFLVKFISVDISYTNMPTFSETNLIIKIHVKYLQFHCKLVHFYSPCSVSHFYCSKHFKYSFVLLLVLILL
jgi:hypothetical protein